MTRSPERNITTDLANFVTLRCSIANERQHFFDASPLTAITDTFTVTMLDYDTIVIGGGPAGITALKTQTEAGAKCALFEAEEEIGGTFRYRSYENSELVSSSVSTITVYRSRGHCADIAPCSPTCFPLLERMQQATDGLHRLSVLALARRPRIFERVLRLPRAIRDTLQFVGRHQFEEQGRLDREEGRCAPCHCLKARRYGSVDVRTLPGFLKADTVLIRDDPIRH